MIDSVELKQKLRRYYNLMEEIQVVIKNLNDSINELNHCDKRMVDYYAINDAAFDNGKITNCKNKIINKRDFLQATVIPSIQYEITKLKKKIAVLSAMENG